MNDPRPLYYRLFGKTPVACSMQDAFRPDVDRSLVCDQIGEAEVSTIFLPLDHSHSGQGPPILFETMIFGGPRDQEQLRYASYDEALAGHARICAELRRAGLKIVSGNGG